MTMAKEACVRHASLYAPGPIHFFSGTITIGATGAVAATSFPGAVTPDGTALFTATRTSQGVYAITSPTGTYGHPIPTIESDNIDVCRVGKGDYDPATGAMVIETLEDDGVTGIPAVADPASGDIIHLTLFVFD